MATPSGTRLPPSWLPRRSLSGGGIDLDPASSLVANQRVRATRIYTEQDDGLAQEWHGRVWMNHPFGKESIKKGHPGNAAWINKLVAEFASGRVTAACCITFAATSERWFQPLARQPQCYLCPRTNYYLPDGTKKPGVLKGSVVTYFGPDVALFAQAFRALGVVKVAIP